MYKIFIFAVLVVQYSFCRKISNYVDDENPLKPNPRKYFLITKKVFAKKTRLGT